MPLRGHGGGGLNTLISQQDLWCVKSNFKDLQKQFLKRFKERKQDMYMLKRIQIAQESK